MSRSQATISLLTEGIPVLILVIGLVIIAGFTPIHDGKAFDPSTKCQGQANCFDGNITELVDGDTLDVNNIRIRLALIDAPEANETGYSEARDFIGSSCDVGTQATVDEDDRQKGGSFGRMIAQVYCGNEPTSINEAILNSGYAEIYQEFCDVSEFATNAWAVKYCSDDELQAEQTTLSSSKVEDESAETGTVANNATDDGNNCDPSYPDFCIQSAPPDLDCSDIPQKMFTVRGSDPHGFDLDGNGEGCES